MLEVSGLHAGYAKTQVLRGVNLNASKGKITCLLGRNGFGKTTTLKAIMGLIDRTGSVKVNGEELIDAPPHLICRAGVALVPQDRRIFPTLTVKENLAMGIKPGQVSTNPLWTSDALMEAFPNLRTRERSFGRNLSGGEQQMLSVARALISDPEVVLLDEPTEGLSPIMVESLESVILQTAERNAAILLVESKLSVALRLADEIYILWKGETIYAGTPEQVNSNEKLRRDYLEI